MTNLNLDAWFEHYGIKGMRWGVRRDNPSGNKKTTSQVASTLTDKELKKRVERLNMEKRYVDLVAGKNERDKSNFAKGQKAVTNAVFKLGTDVVKEVIKEEVKGAIQDYTKVMTEQAKELKKAFGE